MEPIATVEHKMPLRYLTHKEIFKRDGYFFFPSEIKLKQKSYQDFLGPLFWYEPDSTKNNILHINVYSVPDAV